MPNGKSGWDGPLKLDFDMRRFKQQLAIEMKGFTPQKTGALRAANRIFDLGNNTLKVANKQTYALAQHDGAVFKQGATWFQRHGDKRVQHTRRVATWETTGHEWVPKGLDRASETIGVSWAKAAA